MVYILIFCAVAQAVTLLALYNTQRKLNIIKKHQCKTMSLLSKSHHITCDFLGMILSSQSYTVDKWLKDLIENEEYELAEHVKKMIEKANELIDYSNEIQNEHYE